MMIRLLHTDTVHVPAMFTCDSELAVT